MRADQRRWIVPDKVGSEDDRQAYWEHAHGEADYESVFSVGEDENVRRAIMEELRRAEPLREILIAGCGSRIDLQKEVLEKVTDAQVTATDFDKVIALARARYVHPRLRYVALESGERFDGRFDVVIAINVLVMSRDRANRDLLDEWAAALSPGGRLVALTPALFCGLDLGLLSERADIYECVDIEGSAWIERHQGIRQIEYSPLRLRRIVKEAGLRLESLRLVFLEGRSSREQSRLHYGIVDDDLIVYEQLVVAKR